MNDSVPAGTGPAAARTPVPGDIVSLRAQVQELIDGARAAEADQAERIARVRPEHRDSAANLVHYVWLRGRDIRTLQSRLARLGLSSLGRIESRVLPTLESIAATLDCLGAVVAGSASQQENRAGQGAGPGDVGSAGTGTAVGDRTAEPGPPGTVTPAGRWPDMHAGPERLKANADHLLGPRPEERVSRIMVTFPSEAATDIGLVAGMLAAGMDVARINCAHDGPGGWAAMIGNLREAQGRGAVPGPSDGGPRHSPGGEAAPDRCLVAMDLAGPKLRTGPIAPGPEVVKAKPERSATGQVLSPATVRLVAGDPADPDGADPDGADRAGRGAATPVEAGWTVPVRDSGWLHARAAGQQIRCTDARGADRTLTVVAVGPGLVTCELARTAYFTPGTVLRSGDGTTTEVAALPPTSQHLFVRRGEQIVLTRSLEPARPVPSGPHRIGCTLDQVFADARVGHRIHFDDGRISGVVTAVTPEEIEVKVQAAGVDGAKLKAEKGINLPDTRLEIPALTEDDRAALPFVADHADMVSLSFVRSAQDVADLLGRLRDLGREDLDVVLKIETVEAFENLPQILLEAMTWKDFGVMIARGDLAVEAGFQRLAEVQEEILWLCESGHVPVIWATQVLDTLARTGLPSRAEVTDAAMAERAECVMLNKGPFVVEAIEFLSGVLGRMQEHVSKKRTLLRRLRSWELSAE